MISTSPTAWSPDPIALLEPTTSTAFSGARSWPNSPAEAQPAAEYEQGWSTLNERLRSDATWSGYERNVFYANNYGSSFSDISAAVGLDFLEDGRSFALADFDHDGRLELLS